MAPNELTIDSSDIIRLIQAHLVETGLSESCRVLRDESGVRGAGVAHSQWNSWATSGNWGAILASLETVDVLKCGISDDILADVYEMTILELAEVGEVTLAHVTLRLVADHLDRNLLSKSDQDIPRSRHLEQTLASLASNPNKAPADYYGPLGKQGRRRSVGEALHHCVPRLPACRLTSLIQQAIKWQAHTGQLPVIKAMFEEQQGDQKRKKKKRKFDLVLGESRLLPTSTNDDVKESIPTSVYSIISFGKKATCEVATFLPDSSGLITGSSDGLIEIWDPHQKYTTLRMDLVYQQNDELMGHDDSSISSMTVSNDCLLLATGDNKGDVKVWKLDTGICLRSILAHPGHVIADLCFSPDGSQILTASHDGTCREFSLRSSRLLKEFRGHTSFVNSCHYNVPREKSVRVVTTSADGTTRIWDSKSAECMFILRPLSLGDHLSEYGSSVLIHAGDAMSVESNSPNVIAAIRLHTPPQSMILVPRGSRAFLVTESGSVLRVFDVPDKKAVFVTACVSPSNQWLYMVTDLGPCHVFDVASGHLKETMRSFAEQSCGQSEHNSPEVTSILHHPTKAIVAAFSNGKDQKKRTLTMWK